MTNISADIFGTTSDGEEVKQFSLSNALGTCVKIIELGGIISSLTCPDKNGVTSNIVLGFDSLGGYINDKAYLGALIGRYANRIANGKFILQGEEFTLGQNDSSNNLHGGPKGFDKVVWQSEIIELEAKPALCLRYVSRDGDQGFPGELSVQVIYQLSEDNALSVKYSAKTDRTTVVNMTQHSYFNLAGQGDILSHHLRLNSSRITPIDTSLIPLQNNLDIENTAFDFREHKPIGRDINHDHEQLMLAKGYDHNFILHAPESGDNETLAAEVFEPASGRGLRVYTSLPGLQFYSGNFLSESGVCSGIEHKPRYGFCLEPQYYPNSPNRADYPSVVLQPGELYEEEIRFELFLATDSA